MGAQWCTQSKRGTIRDFVLESDTRIYTSSLTIEYSPFDTIMLVGASKKGRRKTKTTHGLVVGNWLRIT